jgi:hypothetical protein
MSIWEDFDERVNVRNAHELLVRRRIVVPYQTVRRRSYHAPPRGHPSAERAGIPAGRRLHRAGRGSLLDRPLGARLTGE